MSTPSVRVLLVHANPFQRVLPVPPYGLERLRTAVAGDGANVRILDPFLVADDAVGCTVEALDRFRPDVVGLGIRVLEDCIPIDRLDAPDDEPVDVSWFLPQVRELCGAVASAAPGALVVLGGAGFSACPQECLAYLDVEHGVVGAGEDGFRELLARWRDGRPLDGIPGLVRRGRQGGIERYAMATGAVTLREPAYGPHEGFPVRTRIGCAMQCAYCTAANLLRRHADLDLEPVLDEIEATVQAARGRGITPVSLFFADDEFNLPDERHPVAVLEGLSDRGLAKHVRWRAYFNPQPFSDRLAELVRATNGHVSITVDSADDRVLARSLKPFRRKHLDALVARLVAHDIPADLGLIFGLPGETEQTVAETVAFVRALPPRLEVNYSAGARVYPHTPLSVIAAAEPQHLVGAADATFLAPVVYATPWSPRELARRLADAFADLDHVDRVGAGYRRASTLRSDAYRVVLGHADDDRWPALMDEAAGGADDADLQALLQLAVWHRRYDLATATCGKLLHGPRRRGLRRGRLRGQRAVYAAMDRLSRFTPRAEAT